MHLFPFQGAPAMRYKHLSHAIFGELSPAIAAAVSKLCVEANAAQQDDCVSSDLGNQFVERSMRNTLGVPFISQLNVIGNEEEGMESHGFLGTLTAASPGAVLKGSLTEFAREDNSARAAAKLVGGATNGEFHDRAAIVMVHGVAPRLAAGR